MKNSYIVSRLYDWLFFLGSPLLSLFLGLGVYRILDSSENLRFWIPMFLALGMWSSHTHLSLVFYRSHNNREIFRLYPYRFTLIPVALLLLLFVGPEPLTYVFGAIAIAWDTYHSAMQIFGLGRIYDAKLGNDPLKGRRLDYYFNLVTYYAPLWLGITTTANLKQVMAVTNFLEIQDKLTWLPEVVHVINQGKPWVAIGLILFLGYYVWRYKKMMDNGYVLSRQKVWLLVSTLVIRLVLWQFSFIAASICIGVFHAVQYVGLVWHTEKTRIKGLFGTQSSVLALIFMMGISTSIGFYLLYAETLTGIRLYVFLMLIHFWYDGFIWSVKKNQV